VKPFNTSIPKSKQSAERKKRDLLLSLKTKYKIGIPAGITTIKVDDDVYKSGRTTGLTSGKVLSTNATVNVGYGEEGTVTHDACILVTDMSDGGDSGSLMVVIADGEPYVWGYLFAGSSTTTVCHEIQNAMSALGLSLYTKPPEPPQPPNTIELNFSLVPLGNGEWTLQGIVKDDVDEFRISGAVIIAGNKSATTNINGFYEIQGLTVGEHTVSCTANGYIAQNKVVKITNNEAFEVKHDDV